MWYLDAQPQEHADIDWMNPLAAGIVGAINAAALPAPSDNVVASSNPYNGVRPAPRGMALIGSTGRRIRMGLWGPVTSECTLLYVGNAVGTSGAGFVAAIGSSVSGNYLTLRQGANANYAPSARCVAPSSTDNIATFVGYTSNGVGMPEGHYVMTYKASVAAADRLQVYRDGQLSTAATTPSGAGDGVLSGIDYISLAGNDTISANGPGIGGEQRCYGVFAWNRVLTDAEIFQVSLNPWQLYRSNEFSYPRRSAILSGTITSSATEADIVAGGKTIVLTLAGGATWTPA